MSNHLFFLKRWFFIFSQCLLNTFCLPLSFFSFPPILSFLPTCSSSEKFWNRLQDVWLEWRWRSGHGGIWTGKLSWKVSLSTIIFNTFSCALKLFWSWSAYSDAMQFLKYQICHLEKKSSSLITSGFCVIVFTLNIRNYLSIWLRSKFFWFSNMD